MGIDVSQRGAVFLRLVEGLLDLVAVVQLVQVFQDMAQAVLAIQPGFDQLFAVLLKTSWKYARTTWPNRIGSETFIMVAFK